MTPEEADLYDQILSKLPPGRYKFSSAIAYGSGQKHDHNLVKAALREMEKDGYIHIRRETSNNTPAGRTLEAGITDPGVIFLRKGGYKQKFEVDEKSRVQSVKAERRKLLNDDIKTYASIGGFFLSCLALGWTIFADSKINENKEAIQREKERLDRYETTIIPFTIQRDTASFRKFLELGASDSLGTDSLVEK